MATWKKVLVEGAVAINDLSDASVSSASSAQILVHDGVDSFDNVSVSGDVTIATTGAVTIGADKVVTAKILDANVTTAKLANDAVTADKLADSAVVTANIVDSNVTLPKIANIAAATVLGNATAGAAAPTALTIDANLTAVSENDDTLASAKAIKSYVDGEILTVTAAGFTLDVSGDSGTAQEILNSETLAVVGVTNETETVMTANQVAIGLVDDVVISTLDLTGSGGLTLENDETITNSTNGVVSVSGALAVTGILKSVGNADLVIKTGNENSDATAQITVEQGTDSDILLTPSGSGAVIVGGNLTVQGTTTTVESNNLLVDDTFISLNDNATADADTGIVFGGENNKVFAWDNTAARFSVDLTGGDAGATGGGLSSDGFVCIAHSGAGTPAGTDDQAIAGLEKIGNIFVDTDDNDAIYIYS